MEFVSHGRLLCVVCFVCWISVFLTAAATTSPPTTSPPTTSPPTTSPPTTSSTSSLRPPTTALWPDYARYSQRTTSTTYSIIHNLPFTYYECVTNRIIINKNGYLSIGNSYNSLEPPTPAEWPSFPKLLGVYWSKLTPDRYSANLSMYIGADSWRLTDVTQESPLIKYVKTVISEPEFEPLIVMAATWENVRPTIYVNDEATPLNDNDTATFQVLIATDSQVTYAIRGYDSVWQSPELANATYYAAAYSLGYGERPKISIPGCHAGPEVIRLGTKKPNKDPYTCVEKTQIGVTGMNSSLNILPPCPCYQVQAATDQQFTTVAADPRCYQSKTPPVGGSLLQLCCYNQYGHLLKYTREARVPVPADPTDHRLQDAFEKCCADGLGLCDWFFQRINITKCANYQPAFNKSEMPYLYNSESAKVFTSQTTNNWFAFAVDRSGPPLTFSMLTTLNSTYGLFLTTESYFWGITQALSELRNLTYPQKLVFYATNANNLSTSFAPIFTLCLCEQEGQCQLDSNLLFTLKDRFAPVTVLGFESHEIGNVISMTCDCKGNFTGRFCERPINVCDKCLVQNTSGCDSNPQDYCPPCPGGYRRSGTQCLDIATTTATTTPKDGGNKADVAYLLIILSCITSYTLWIQKLLTSRM